MDEKDFPCSSTERASSPFCRLAALVFSQLPLKLSCTSHAGDQTGCCAATGCCTHCLYARGNKLTWLACSFSFIASGSKGYRLKVPGSQLSIKADMQGEYYILIVKVLPVSKTLDRASSAYNS